MSGQDTTGVYPQIMTAAAPDDVSSAEQRTEIITRGNSNATRALAHGVEFLAFVSRELGGQGLYTGMATFKPGAELPYQTHNVSEAITVLCGQAVIVVQGRHYRMCPYDAMHIPAGVAHLVRNGMPNSDTVLHLAFASDSPVSQCVDDDTVAGFVGKQGDRRQETLRRFNEIDIYELAPGAMFRDLFASRFGSEGICGGYGIFQPGSGLPCHRHEYDESITIIQGVSVLEAAGRTLELSHCDTACVPRGLPHRFVNRGTEPMAMIWVYGGDEPKRTVVDQACCELGICEPDETKIEQ